MLKKYAKKRNFKETPEPPAKLKRTARSTKSSLLFVIQKHAASRLHYDFRLESQGVLLSWAVPKGPSLNPDDKRLAVMVEDHPFDYKNFEGTIPKGHYGAGEVIVWDNGIYSPEEDGSLPKNRSEAESMIKRGLKKGHLSFVLLGQKLKGLWSLIRLRTGNGSPQNQWLLFKHDDEYADRKRKVINLEKSVISDKTIGNLKKHNESKAKTKLHSKRH